MNIYLTNLYRIRTYTPFINITCHNQYDLDPPCGRPPRVSVKALIHKKLNVLKCFYIVYLQFTEVIRYICTCIHIFNHLANYITVDVIFVSKVYSRSTKYKTFLGLLPKDDVENEIMNLLRYFMIF